MGTSGSSKGPGSGTPLVPSWLNDEPATPMPGGEGETPPGDGSGDEAGDHDAGYTLPPITPVPPAGRFLSARRNFSTFAGTRGNDRGALRRGVRDYVRSGTGNSRNATLRMGASREAARGILGVFRGFQRDGVDATLRHLNLAKLAGRPPEDVFLGLTDVICQDGGSIDEGIARDAWLETVVEADGLELDNMAALTADQMKEMFLAFIGHAIEARLFQDIGINGLKIAPDLAAIEAFEAQLRSYIRGAVRDSFSGDLAGLPTYSDRQIYAIVDQTYQDAWDLLVAWGDTEE